MFGIDKGKTEIKQYEKILLSESTMRGKSEYERINVGDKANIAYYQYYYSESRENKRPEKSAECGNDEVIKLLSECKISKWDGCHGKHPKHVLDGTMFSFKALVNEGQEIYADGSQNFPKNYGDLTGWLREKLF